MGFKKKIGQLKGDEMKKSGLIAAIGAALMGGSPVMIGPNGSVQHMSPRERNRVKGKITAHCKSKYKPHQGVNEKARRMRQMGVSVLKEAA